METKQKFFGWKVFAACFLLSVFVTGVISNPFSLYMTPICTELGISTATYSLATMAGTIVMAIATMVWAPKMQKGNMKLFMIICMVITGLGYCIYSFAQNMVLLIVAACVYNIGFAGTTQMPIALLMTMWFNKNRATYMSIAYAGGAVGGAIWAIVVGQLIAGPGWRTSFVYMGLLAAIAGVLIVLFLVKKCPQEIGQTPYEGNPDKVEKTKQLSEKQLARQAAMAEENAWQGVSKKVALKSGSFWMLALTMFCIGICAAGIAQHYPNYLQTEVGMSSTQAATIVSTFTLTAAVGTILGGVLLDRIGAVGSVLFACGVSIVGIICLMMAGMSPALAYIFGVLYGLGSMMPKMVPAILVTKCFGTKEYASIFSIINLVFLLGCSIGSVILGIIQGSAGYRLVWIVSAIIFAVIFLASASAIGGGKKLRAQYPNEEVAPEAPVAE